MAPKNAGSNDPNQNPKPRIAKPIDLSVVVPRNKNMLESELILSYRSYVGESTALGVRVVVETAAKNDKGFAKPAWFLLAGLDGAEVVPGITPLPDIAAIPVLERGPSTISCRWKGEEPRVDLKKLLLLFHFEIPVNHRAYIPMKPDFVEGLGHAVILQFTKARFAPIEERKGKAQQTKGAKTGQAKDPAKPVADNQSAAPASGSEAPKKTGTGEAAS